MYPVSVAPAVLGRRACAVLAASSAVLHGLMVGHTGSAAAAAVLLAMLVVCLFCARDLWRAGSVQSWLLVALMNLGMIAVHWSLPDCHRAASAATVAPGMPTPLMTVATGLALIEAVIATAVLCAVSRRRAAVEIWREHRSLAEA